MHIKGLDIYGAFITANIAGTGTDVYVQLPKGLRSDIDGHPPIWKLNKTLYGLRRSPQGAIDTTHRQRLNTLN
jgi:hypothetical protein